ncbi:MAG: hypothetical protein EXR11_06505 [Rhodospirillaceae bacterium]|nr:hypothetical protein [Rhodospirillaceae bacterium]
MKKTIALFFTFITGAASALAIVLLGGGDSPGEHEASEDQCKIIRIAERYLAAQAPNFETIDKRVVIEDAENRWKVYFMPPPPNTQGGTHGGEILIIIDKAELKVVGSQLGL